MVNAIPLLLATAASLAACSTRQGEDVSPPPTAPETRPDKKIEPSPWQPPAEVDPPHQSPGDRVDPEPGKSKPSQAPRTPS